MAPNTGFTLWLTGMSGTGKSTTAAYIAARLRQVGRQVEILDEGELGEALWAGLGDAKEDRTTVVRRLGFVANLLVKPVASKWHESAEAVEEFTHEHHTPERSAAR